jgi:hypothetical protein
MEELRLHKAYAHGKGISLSAMAKLALIQYEQRNPLKPLQLAEAVSKYVQTMEGLKAVQPQTLGANSGGGR